MAKKAKLNKILLTIIVVITIAAAAVVGISAAVRAADRNKIKSGLYNGLDWGISKEEIIESIGKDYTDNAGKNCILNKVSDYEGINGLEAAEAYVYENGLNEVVVVLMRTEDCKYSGEEVVDRLSGIYDKRFGRHEEETYFYKWTTDKTVIKLNFVSSKTFMISYQDINTAGR